MSKETIFREVEVDTGVITLGAAVPKDVQPLLDSAGPNTYRFKPGTYSRAESITVVLNASTQYVQSMTFRYPPGTDYNALVAEYTEGLGDPASQSGSSATWRDSETTFQLTGNGGSVTSVLTDGGGTASAA